LSHLLPTTLAFFTPQSGGSPNADEIGDLYKIVLYVGLVIFIGVEGALAYALYRFRARKGAVAAQVHGNTRLEVGWTAGAALVVIALAILTVVKLSSIQSPPNSGPTGDTLFGDGTSGALYATADRKLPPNGKSLTIKVIGRQFIWQYVYPGAAKSDGLGAPYSYEEMVVPTETTVTLDIVSEDVVHAWWIPELGGKFQAVPGYNNYTWFKIPKLPKPRVYRGQCALICGRGHARMIAAVRAVSPPEFDRWLAERKRAIEEANTDAAQERATLNKQSGPGQVENP
jgi:cytochrome c oxidase subunit II